MPNSAMMVKMIAPGKGGKRYKWDSGKRTGRCTRIVFGDPIAVSMVISTVYRSRTE